MKYRDFTNKEKEWIKKFEKIMKSAPNTLFMFVGSGCTIYTKNENGHRYMNGTSIDEKAPSIDIISPIEMDGGDW